MGRDLEMDLRRQPAVFQARDDDSPHLVAPKSPSPSLQYQIILH